MKMLILGLIGLKLLTDYEGMEKLTKSVEGFVPWIMLLNLLDGVWGDDG